MLENRPKKVMESRTPPRVNASGFAERQLARRVGRSSQACTCLAVRPRSVVNTFSQSNKILNAFSNIKIVLSSKVVYVVFLLDYWNFPSILLGFSAVRCLGSMQDRGRIVFAVQFLYSLEGKCEQNGQKPKQQMDVPALGSHAQTEERASDGLRTGYGKGRAWRPSRLAGSSCRASLWAASPRLSPQPSAESAWWPFCPCCGPLPSPHLRSPRSQSETLSLGLRRLWASLILSSNHTPCWFALLSLGTVVKILSSSFPS